MLLKQYRLMVFDPDSPIPNEAIYHTFDDALTEAKSIKDKKWQILEVTSTNNSSDEKVILNSDDNSEISKSGQI